MSGHTPGPWEANVVDHGDREDGCEEWVSVIDSSKGRICYVGPTGELAMADARLIAAAPDLLEALKEVAESFDGPDASACIGGIAMNKALLAIAKAEGR